MENDRKGVITDEAVKLAQAQARANGLDIGSLVAHPSDPVTYRLYDVKGENATVFLCGDLTEDGKPVFKKFPIEELFNPNIAIIIAKEIKTVLVLQNVANN